MRPQVPAVEVAARAAGALKASKLIYLTGARLVMHSQLGGAGASALPVDQRPLVQSMRLAEARELVRAWDARSEVAAARLPEAADPAARSRYESAEFVVGGLCKRCVEALSSGVNRAPPLPAAAAAAARAPALPASLLRPAARPDSSPAAAPRPGAHPSPPLSPPLPPSPPSLSLHPSLQLSHYGGSPVRRTESLTHSHCLASRL